MSQKRVALTQAEVITLLHKVMNEGYEGQGMSVDNQSELEAHVIYGWRSGLNAGIKCIHDTVAKEQRKRNQELSRRR